MGDFEESTSGKISKQDFLKKYGRKIELNTVAKATGQAKPKPKLVKKVELPEEFEVPEEYEDPEGWDVKGVSPEAAEDMRLAEREVTQRQVIEYKEQTEPTPESQAEMDNKLLQVAARMSVRKELIDARAPDGTMRKVSIPLEEEYPEIFTEDLIKGNYGDVECACIFGNGSLINSMKSIGQAKDFSLVEASRFNKNQMALMINLSRGKNGFSAVLVKTDKHVSEGVVSHVQRAYAEKKEMKEKRWGFI